MEYKDIQSIFIVYGAKYEIKKLLNKKLLSIAKGKNQKIKLKEVKNNTHSLFKDIKNFVWEGD